MDDATIQGVEDQGLLHNLRVVDLSRLNVVQVKNATQYQTLKYYRMVERGNVLRAGVSD